VFAGKNSTQFALPILGDIFFTRIDRLVNLMDVVSDFVVHGFRQKQVAEIGHSKHPRRPRIHDVIDHEQYIGTAGIRRSVVGAPRVSKTIFAFSPPDFGSPLIAGQSALIG
jgi:hypothetical protein